MNLRIVKKNIFRHIKNLHGWSTSRKIVVIDSDDWGSIRMPSKKAYQRLLAKGLNLNGGDGLRYSLYDTIASATDLELLFDVLSSFKDINGSHVKLTANSVVANPDFDRIREDDFKNYYYEPTTKTMRRYYGSDRSFELWKEGMYHEVFIPQFHGREHLNVSLWMDALRKNDEETKMAFNEGMWAFIPKILENSGLEYEAAFQLSEYATIECQKEVISDGLDLFEKLLGKRAQYFVPPNGKINNKLNSSIYDDYIRYRSASRIQYEHTEEGTVNKVYHWLGQLDSSGIRYLVRNCNFEPSQTGKDWVDNCMKDIDVAFMYGKPAIISSHRVNYIGGHDVKNRDNGLTELKELLRTILRVWPDVEFFSSDQLGDLMSGKDI